MTQDLAAESPRESESTVLRAMRRVLRPLARIMLSQRISFQQASELLKQVYVDVARDDLVDQRGQPSISRISLFTGIHRKEVKRLRDNEAGEIQIPKSVSQGAQIIEVWTASPRYLDEEGKPLALPRAPDASDGPNFDELIRSVTSDVHSRTVLDEWLRLGLVFVGGDGRIHLTRAAFVPTHGLDEKLFYFERNLHDHLAVAGVNLEDRKDPLLERSVHYRDLPGDAVEELERLARREGMKVLEVVNRRARALREQAEGDPSANPTPGDRMNFGLYFYRDSAKGLGTVAGSRESDDV
ncbi:MAG: hypothetical protein GY944_25415 [bacterium]|nr:hypothetical protein [bacterium]MCP5044383.1 hypothetical protein [bacterium]